ncbi:hypothetical protein [Marinobacter sp. LV10MA510-1]|uniref:hypothetical protein n=1 Tax=Marinobacter sp. LV10MA510-1 TaxID=1415567 RepID=UPI000BF6B9EA|nr:hypothetical protein [Marinobacter sp. LV10MA510-1]PFG09258.1 hypothetical protein ATI45_1624 [Marinobacter sp. LV10MA510-1]
MSNSISKIPFARIKVAYVAGFLSIFFSLFSWVGFGILNLDSQPYALMFWLFFLGMSYRFVKFPKLLLLPLIFAYLGFFLATLADLSSLDINLLGRAGFNYLSFYIIFIGFYNFISRFGVPINLLWFALFLWAMGALAEIFYPEVMSILSPRRTTSDRGLTSFAPEPTFFAVFSIFVLWIICCHYSYSRRIVVLSLFTSLVFVVVLAKSTMGILFLSIFLVFIFLYVTLKKWVSWKDPFLLLATAFSVLAIPYFGAQYFSNASDINRIGVVVKSVFLEGKYLDIFLSDASMNSRLEDVVFSFHGFFMNLGMPGGGFELL